MQIVFCERCGMRISPKDLESGRCKREDILAWCPTCTQAVGAAAAKPAVAQVVAAPMAQTPQGVMEVGAAQASGQQVARRPSGGRPSMLAPPTEESLRGRRPTTSSNQRPASGATRTLGAAANAAAPSTRKLPQAKPTAVRRSTPVPAGSGATSGRDSGRLPPVDLPPKRDLTMVYIGAGAGLLALAILMSLFIFKKDTPAAHSQQGVPAAKTASTPSTKENIKSHEPQKTPERVVPDTAKTTASKTTSSGIAVIRPTDTQKTQETPKIVETPKKDEGNLPADAPRLLVAKPSEEPALDGALEDACWSNAKEQVLEFIEGKVGRPKARSTVKFLATAKTLYIGAHFEEDEMTKVPMPVKEKDSDSWADDCVELFMLPGLDATKDYYQWVVNVSGVIWDGKRVGTTTNPGMWDSEGIKHKIKIGDTYWNVEIAVPFDSVPGASGQANMRFNLTRNRPKAPSLSRPEEYSSWSILRTGSSHTPMRYGLLVFDALGGKLP